MRARCIASLLCVVIAGSIVVAEDAGGPFITAGQAGLLYNFDGFNAGTLLQNGIGGKLFVSNNLALRGAIQFATVSQTEPFYSSSTAVTGVDGSESATLIGAMAGLEYHFTQSRLSPYIGGEVRFNTVSTSAKDAEETGVAQTTTDNGVDGVLGYYGGLTFGVGAITGVEFFLAKGVSLGVEYRLEWSMVSQYDETQSDGTITETTAKGPSTYQFGLVSGGGLTLNVYF
jgi:hypothetical protein